MLEYMLAHSMESTASEFRRECGLSDSADTGTKAKGMFTASTIHKIVYIA